MFTSHDVDFDDIDMDDWAEARSFPCFHSNDDPSPFGADLDGEELSSGFTVSRPEVIDLPDDEAFAQARLLPELNVAWVDGDWPTPSNVPLAFALCENPS